LIPVCPDDRYFFFESRSFGSSTVHPISVLASEWASQEFGASGSRPYLALPPAESEPRVTVSFGVGENSAKRVGEAFEIGVLQELVRRGAKVLVDQGAGGEEAERVQLAVDQTAGVPGQVKMFQGPFAAFAARIARSPLYIGYDSAGQHAAAALGVPAITVFAGHPNERFLRRWHPYGTGTRTTLLADAPDLMERVTAAIDQTLGRN
jgi:ADP-heptose:LPS heptosyltransferase